MLGVGSHFYRAGEEVNDIDKRDSTGSTVRREKIKKCHHPFAMYVLDRQSRDR